MKGGNVLGQLGAIYDLLGSPTDNTWPGVKKLPDFGKLTFTNRNPRPIEAQIPRVLESPGLLQVLGNLLVLDPTRRYGAKQVLGHTWLRSPTNNIEIDRSSMRAELIPDCLREPVLLSQPDLDLTVASKQALSVATTSRNLLSSIQEWNENSSTELSLAQRCHQLCPALRSA